MKNLIEFHSGSIDGGEDADIEISSEPFEDFEEVDTQFFLESLCDKYKNSAEDITNQVNKINPSDKIYIQ